MRYLIVLLVGFPAFATEMRATTLLGDRRGNFLVKNENGKASIEMTIDNQMPKSRKLKKKEWDFLVKEFKKLPQARNIPPECDRARMDVVLIDNKLETKKSSCFGVKTITSESYAKFAQMLTLAF